MKRLIILLFIISFSPDYLFSQGTQIQHIDFLVKNEANSDYQGVLWINAEDIYSLLPEFDGFSLIVTTTHSPDIAADLKKKETEETLNVASKLKNVKLLYNTGRIKEGIAYLYTIYTDLALQKYGVRKTFSQTIRDFAIIMVKQYGQDPANIYPFIQQPFAAI